DAVVGSFKVWVDRLATSTTLNSSQTIGEAVDAIVSLADANFLTPAKTGTFSINGVQIAVDASTDSLDDVISRINSSGAGVTARLTTDASGRSNLLELSSESSIQVGSAGDTSNFLQITRLQTATEQPSGAATILGTAVAAGQIAG